MIQIIQYFKCANLRLFFVIDYSIDRASLGFGLLVVQNPTFDVVRLDYGELEQPFSTCTHILETTFLIEQLRQSSD